MKAVDSMVVFPSSLTEEEEALQKKYAKLKKKVLVIVIAETCILESDVGGFVIN